MNLQQCIQKWVDYRAQTMRHSQVMQERGQPQLAFESFQELRNLDSFISDLRELEKDERQNRGPG